MKKILLIAVAFLIVVSCQKSSVKKPDNLIPEEKMVDIIFDLSLLEAVKSQSYNAKGDKMNINPNAFIFSKYKVDSIQFAKSDQYYASDVSNYKKIYEQVNERIKKKIEEDGRNPILKKQEGELQEVSEEELKRRGIKIPE